MKKLDITWEKGIYDPTGYLFSFAKSLAASLKCSGISGNAEDAVAATGFAFRIWVDGKGLCPSATSIFDFGLLASGLENAGYSCEYVGRYWGQEHIEEPKRLEAVGVIKKAIDNNIAPVVWDVGLPEWGLVIGYDDKKQCFSFLAINNETGEMPYEKLGKREIPILSVTVPTKRTDKSEESILKDTLRIAANHAKGMEWCENKKGLEAYPALANFFKVENFNPALNWNMEYYLGTYAALRYYAWKYLEKMSGKYPYVREIAQEYKNVYTNLQAAFDCKKQKDFNKESALVKIHEHISTAGKCEAECIALIK